MAEESNSKRERSQSLDLPSSSSKTEEELEAEIDDRQRASSHSGSVQYVPHRFFLRSDLGTYWTLKVTPTTLASDICAEVAERLALHKDTFRLAFIGQFQRMEKENVIPPDMNLWNKMRQMATLITSGKARFVVIEKDKINEALGRIISLDEETLAQKVSDPSFNATRSQEIKEAFMRENGLSEADVASLTKPAETTVKTQR